MKLSKQKKAEIKILKYFNHKQEAKATLKEAKKWKK